MSHTLLRPDHGVSTLRVPNLSDIDFGRLRAGRLERLQHCMVEDGLPAVLLFSPVNIRYATGTDVMGVWTQGFFARYCIVPAVGDPVLFEYKSSMFVSEKLVRDIRPAEGWEFASVGRRVDVARRWADTITSTLRELGLDGEPVGVDRLDALGFLALQQAGTHIVDPLPTIQRARSIKSPEEIELLALNGAIGDTMLEAFKQAIRPGIREYELFAVLGQSLLEQHGEVLSTRLVASGTNTNPWMSEAHDKQVRRGDLVAVDTDAAGYEGYVIDVSRTFLCGDEPTAGQIEAYRAAHECVTGMRELAKPGCSWESFVRNAPTLPAKYRAQRYGAMAHQIGLEDEAPAIPWPEDAADGTMPIPEGEIEENMAICFEAYAGELGGAYGVKLEDQVVVTAAGAQLVCTYPFEAVLLG
jgi:Xaa-Pro aminopeptidase